MKNKLLKYFSHKESLKRRRKKSKMRQFYSTKLSVLCQSIFSHKKIKLEFSSTSYTSINYGNKSSWVSFLEVV